MIRHRVQFLGLKEALLELRRLVRLKKRAERAAGRFRDAADRAARDARAAARRSSR